MNTPARAGRRTLAARSPSRIGAADLPADLGREQVALALEASSALWRGFETMRAVQQRAVHESSQRHQAAARQLGRTANASELMIIPFTLLQQDLQGASRCWQDLAAAALETQTEMIECALAHAVEADQAIEAVAAVAHLQAVPGVTAPLAPDAPAKRRRRARARR
ncbi:phasin family protein [Ramlibacter sp.]|uniref:phasin family protein n=1 Tax=Ramlibacter sp. TaxID=1917967 RepID=UPI002C1B8485|nr:phasin family protein [Ramlibacter sp.]HWI81114.1 phasin family protein [Ramlibacter sp.]